MQTRSCGFVTFVTASPPLITTTMDEDIPQLSTGVCDKIASSSGAQDPVWSSSPVMQIVQAKAIETNGQTRWRTVISDGLHVLQAMVVTQLNTLFENGDAGKGSIVRIQRFAINTIQGRRIVIILGLEILVKDTEKIGNPTPRTLDPPGTTSKPPSTVGPAVPRTAPPKPSRPTLPIEGLSPYSNNWTIRARVTQKSEIRTWSNQRGEGKLFSVTLMDETGEIRGTAFNLAVDNLYDKFQEGKVYYVSKARVNLAKKKFNNVANDYELALEKNTEIEECTDQSDVPDIKYSFVPLDDLINKPKDSTCDVLAVVSEVGEVASISTKTNRTTSKRELTLVDRTNSSIRLTLWGKQAETYEDDGSNPVIAFKGVRIGEFQGRSLSMISSSIMTLNPDLPDALVLRGWYDSVGATTSFTAYTMGSGSGGGAAFNRAEVRTIEDIKENLQIAEKAEMFSCRGTILHIRGENPAYPACPNQTCKKKVIETGDAWHCEKCEKSWEKPEYRYIISMAVSDHTGQAWLQGFHDVGLAVFNMSADELMEIKTNDPAKYPAILAKSSYSTFNFACRAKLDTYQDQSRVRYGISRILPLNYREEAAYLRDIIKKNWPN